MAKETKEDRLIREAIEKKCRFEVNQSEYPTRMMAALLDAADIGFTTTPVPSNMSFFVNDTDRDWGYDIAYCMQDWEDFHELTRLEAHIKFCRALLDEEIQKQAMRVAALNKLTKEERELLGI